LEGAPEGGGRGAAFILRAAGKIPLRLTQAIKGAKVGTGQRGPLFFNPQGLGGPILTCMDRAGGQGGVCDKPPRTGCPQGRPNKIRTICDGFNVPSVLGGEG